MALYRLSLLGGLLLCLSCASKTEDLSGPLAKGEGIYRSSLRPADLFEEVSQFLQWERGYSVPIADPSRGLIVTGWMMEDNFVRHRLSLRINQDVQGSLLTAHANVQEFVQGQWVEAFKGHAREKDFILSLRRHFQQSPSTR